MFEGTPVASDFPIGGKSKIAFLGEAPGADEEGMGKVFVGTSGQLLNELEKHAGIERKRCYHGNVFSHRPPDNKLAPWCVSQAEAKGLSEGTHPWYPWLMTGLAPGQYVRPERLGAELERVKAEIESVKPNIVVTLGNTAAWAMLRQTRVTKIRGTVCESVLIPGLKVLPTLHPAYILRQWDMKIVMIADLMKAKIESQYPEIRAPDREIWLEPTLEDLPRWWLAYYKPGDTLTFDIETRKGYITCISFSTNAGNGISIPMVDSRKPRGAYWPTPEADLKAMEFIREKLENPSIPKSAQNGLYDIQWLWDRWHIQVLNFEHDTMLLHHALQPELPKGLDFLGSIYTNERAWKTWGPRGQDHTKREE